LLATQECYSVMYHYNYTIDRDRNVEKLRNKNSSDPYGLNELPEA